MIEKETLDMEKCFEEMGYAFKAFHEAWDKVSDNFKELEEALDEKKPD